MKRLKAKQIGPRCSYCVDFFQRATHRQDGFAGKFCCDSHKPNLEMQEAQDRELERRERRTEADYSTWESL